MRTGMLAGLLTLSLLGGFNIPCLALDISPDKLKAYAEIYPDIFKMSTHTVSYTTATGSGNKTQAVNLLLNSFNGNTDYEGLSAALGPGSYSSLKPDNQLKQMLASKGLSWQDYQEITRQVASNPEAFDTFFTMVNRNRLEAQVVSQTQQDPSFLRQVPSPEQQRILKNIIASLRK